MLMARNRKARQKVVRLHKRGKKYYPVYEVVLTYKDNRNRGRCIEKLGFLNPNAKNRLFFLNTSRLSHWLNKGVIVNKTVKRYLVKFLVAY